MIQRPMVTSGINGSCVALTWATLAFVESRTLWPLQENGITNGFGEVYSGVLEIVHLQSLRVVASV